MAGGSSRFPLLLSPTLSEAARGLKRGEDETPLLLRPSELVTGSPANKLNEQLDAVPEIEPQTATAHGHAFTPQLHPHEHRSLEAPHIAKS